MAPVLSAGRFPLGFSHGVLPLEGDEADDVEGRVPGYVALFGVVDAALMALLACASEDATDYGETAGTMYV